MRLCVFYFITFLILFSKIIHADENLDKKIEQVIQNPTYWGKVMGCAIRLQTLASQTRDVRGEEITMLLGDDSGFNLLDTILPLVQMKPPTGIQPEEFRNIILGRVQQEIEEGSAWVTASNCIVMLTYNGFLNYNDINPNADGFFILHSQ